MTSTIGLELRILAVDDRQENLVALEALLAPEATIDLARSGGEALELLLRHDYAAAIVDVQMPEMNGFDLARLMRGAERTKRVPVLFVTAGAFDEAQVFEGYEAGAVDFLAKPVDPHVLRSKVRVFLELARTRAALTRSVAAREQLNEELHQAVADLARANAMLDRLLDHAPIGVAFFDRELRFRHINRAMAAMNGVPPDAHLGRTIPEVLPALPAAEVEELLRRVLETGEPLVDHELHGETPATGGERRWWRETYYPVSVGPSTIGVGVLARDVTLEKRAEELQRFLFGVVGHDLRNPLSAITTTLQLLSKGEPLADRQRGHVERMRRACGRMRRLIDDLLDYTRVRGGGQIPIARARADIAEVIEPVVEEARAASPGREIRVSGAGVGAGEWDAERLRQVISNLLGNALKYGAAGSPVEVAWRGEGDEVVIEVRNEGAPIAAAELASIFEPLTRGAPADDRSGIGLGLFIARSIARAHGGGIDVRSGAGGTTFAVRLPRSAPP
jgi:PAS domain S-box-containing protein